MLNFKEKKNKLRLCLQHHLWTSQTSFNLNPYSPFPPRPSKRFPWNLGLVKASILQQIHLYVHPGSEEDYTHPKISDLDSTTFTRLRHSSFLSNQRLSQFGQHSPPEIPWGTRDQQGLLPITLYDRSRSTTRGQPPYRGFT